MAKGRQTTGHKDRQFYPIVESPRTGNHYLYDMVCNCAYSKDGTPSSASTYMADWKVVGYARNVFAWQSGQMVVACADRFVAEEISWLNGSGPKPAWLGDETDDEPEDEDAE